MSYLIKKAACTPVLDGNFTMEPWKSANPIAIDNFRKESSDHHPHVECRMVYDDHGVYLLYTVKDRYVRSVVTEFQGSVCGDSCVEFFVAPSNFKGYINFEFNAGGTLLAYHVFDPSPTHQGLGKFRAMERVELHGMKIEHSLPEVIEPEMTQPTTWTLGTFIPFSTFGREGVAKGEVWRANFYKCGDKTSHPHWASWQPVSILNFHLPECFGEIIFE